MWWGVPWHYCFTEWQNKIRNGYKNGPRQVQEWSAKTSSDEILWLVLHVSELLIYYKNCKFKCLHWLNIYICTIKHWLFLNITAMMINKTLQVPTLLPNYWSHYIKHNNVIKMPLSNKLLFVVPVCEVFWFSNISPCQDRMLMMPYFFLTNWLSST